MVAVLDADFTPQPDFLKRAIAYLVGDPTLCAVQGRWGHLNGDVNPLTRAITLAIDGHFVVEQICAQPRGLADELQRIGVACGASRPSRRRAAGGILR